MTPYEIGLMLHIGSSNNPHRTSGLPLYTATVEKFLAQQLVVHGEVEPHPLYLTNRGEAYVRSLTVVPLPDQCWKTDWQSLADPA